MVHVFCEHLSPVDESACNPKPKSVRQTGRYPFNAEHNDLANDSPWRVKTWAQLGRKTPPLRHEIRECRRVRPTDSTGLMVGAVGIEEKPQFLSLIVRWRCSRSFQQLLILLIQFG
jgi:hypothetical protein